MAVDFVSEVDRKFFANNLLTNEDWDPGNMDLCEILGDPTLNPDYLADLPDDLHIPMDDDSLSPFSEANFHDDLWQDYSDSSDSGIGGICANGDVLIKQEPLSPASSICSELSESTEFLPSQIPNSPMKLPVTINLKDDTPPLSPSPSTHVTIPSTDSHTFSFGPSEEDVKPMYVIASPVSGTTVVRTSGSVPNINSILNSNIKIQPKPAVGSQPPAPTPTPTTQQNPVKPASGKPLVLTAQEFARLTAQGLLKFHPPSQEGKSPSPGPSSTAPSTATPLVIPNVPVVNDADKVVRRQQRMIKNRESASLSRRRKKEYLSTLEVRLHQFTQENEKLKQENDNLKRKLLEIQSENNKLKQVFPSSAKKTCLMVVVVILCLNLGSFSIVSDMISSKGSRMKEPLPVPVIHKGRQLLSTNNGPEQPSASRSYWPFTAEETLDQLRSFLENHVTGGSVGNQNFKDLAWYTCPSYFNKTESVRLAEQLAGWMQSHEKEKSKKAEKKHQRQNRKKQHWPLNKIKPTMKDDIRVVDNDKYRSANEKYEVSVFNGPDSGRDFLKALHRRNDTFYVLSFNQDYYLVPAEAHNKTMRPRMSLVMPAVALNETMQPPSDSVGMMQIDCEVLNTQLIHVQKSSLPRNVWQKNRTITPPPGAGAEDEDYPFHH